MSLGHSQGKARRGTYGKGQPYYTAAPCYLGGVHIACLWSTEIGSLIVDP